MASRHLEVLTRRRRTRLTWLWHVEGKDEVPLMRLDIKPWLWPCETKGWNSFDVNLISNMVCYVYMNNIYVFIMLAHPICLCLAMIVYAVHVSR